MRLELIVCLNLQASHSLEEREAPHFHRWEIQVGLLGNPKNGRIVSLTKAQQVFAEVLQPLQDTFLNDNNYLDSDSQAHPTCENLASFLLAKFQACILGWASEGRPELTFVQVGLWENQGLLGFAKLSI